MILKSDELPIRRIHEQIADEPPLASARGDVKDPDSRDRRTRLRHVLVPEELIAATDREDRGAALDRRPERRAVRSREIGADDVLSLVLATPEKPYIWPPRVRPLADRVRPHLDLDPTPLRALRERDHIAAVAVDVHQVWIEMGDA